MQNVNDPIIMSSILWMKCIVYFPSITCDLLVLVTDIYNLFRLQVAVPDLVEAAKDADILIFVVPHQFIPGQCKQLLGKIKPTAVGLSLIKGFDVAEGGGIKLISSIITENLSIPCYVLMGANLANEVAEEHFCETTIGCNNKNLKVRNVLRDMMQAPYFRVVVVDDCNTVEVCGALKVTYYHDRSQHVISKFNIYVVWLHIEYCCLRCWFCWRFKIGRQHESSRHSFGPYGNDQVCWSLLSW